MTNILTEDNYFQDKTMLSNSTLRNFVSYNKYWNRELTPDDFVANHILWEEKTFACDDAIKVWKIVDKYFELWPIEWAEYVESYKAVVRRSGKDEFEITKWMKSDIDSIIEKGLNFKRFMDFLKTPWTESQVILTWKLKTILLKWKPDFINRYIKEIMDLKTTWSIWMIMDELFYINKDWQKIVNLNAPYIKQLSIYNYMAWWDFYWSLALISSTWRRYIKISNRVLKKAFEQIEKDLIELQEFIDTWIYPDDTLDIIKQEEITL